MNVCYGPSEISRINKPDLLIFKNMATLCKITLGRQSEVQFGNSSLCAILGHEKAQQRICVPRQEPKQNFKHVVIFDSFQTA
jgi:hypothetical protein